MSRTRLVAFSLLLTSAVSAAFVGGIFDVPISVVGVPGTASGSFGGGFTLRQAVGHPQGVVATMAGGGFELHSGFVAASRQGAPGPSAAATTLDSSMVRFDSVGGKFLGYVPGQPLVFTFSQPMNPASFAGGILLERTESPVGIALSSPAPEPLDFSYDTTTYRVSCTPPSGALAYNSSFRLTLSSHVLDSEDNSLAQTSAFGFSTLANQSEDSRIAASDAKTTVDVPSAAAPADYYTVIRVDPVNQPEKMNVAAYQAATMKAQTSYNAYLTPVPGAVREFTAYDSAHHLISSFAKPVTVEIPFTDANHDGIVDGTLPPIRVQSLAVWWLDESQKLWVRLPDPKLDLARGVVSAETAHFSAFALIGAMDTNLDFVQVFPIPFRPNAGDPARFGTASEGIKFWSLPSSVDIDIYTLTGRLVRRIHHEGLPNQTQWLGDNDDGQRVASGVYRYIMRSGSNKKIGKVMVIW